MDKEYVMQIAQTIKMQLVSMTPMPVFMSWGVTEFAATVFKDLPALRLEVNGRLHTGYVIIALNGSDYYEVYLLKGASSECVNEEVCFDELGDVIDRAIESGTDKKEYDNFCNQQLAVLVSGKRA
ncbi:hypothetical protein [Parabacteroides distasonis]|uniref:hypothetical protein n=1 Tax=Parabacteroides distasonis TaxID=823 RepID=UPI00189BBB3F|nr:hypothetical protein [Parabacteroides distasonis]MDB9190830.1 hypothetical protein [Parabacteroides distasonis]MDB9199692.1 hypothetical protein [Parabacteroides distasonis]